MRLLFLFFILLKPFHYDMAITADTLYADYKSDVKLADQKYKGKHILIKGKLFNFIRPTSGEIHTLFLNTLTDPNKYILAETTTDEAMEFVNRENDKVIVLRCLGSGRIRNTPYLTECYVVQ